VTTLSITHVAGVAGVQRSTFYAHAPDPPALLRSALTARLDELRADLLDDTGRDTDAAVADVTSRVMEHVRDHAAIYRRGLADDAGSGSLHGMLSEHFLESSRLLRAQGRVDLPLPEVRGVSRRRVDDAALQLIALGTVGVIRAWLELPGKPSVPAFERLYAALIPSWWVQRPAPPTPEG
jgi:AcrR family transcriptional regulator